MAWSKNRNVHCIVLTFRLAKWWWNCVHISVEGSQQSRQQMPQIQKECVQNRCKTPSSLFFLLRKLENSIIHTHGAIEFTLIYACLAQFSNVFIKLSEWTIILRSPNMYNKSSGWRDWSTPIGYSCLKYMSRWMAKMHKQAIATNSRIGDAFLLVVRAIFSSLLAENIEKPLTTSTLGFFSLPFSLVDLLSALVYL